MKKYIGFGLWILAFSLPFQYSILNSSEVVHPDGSANNIKGLVAFVARLALVFAGYVLVDSSKGPKAGDAHAH